MANPLDRIITNIRKLVNDDLTSQQPAVQSSVIVAELGSALAYALDVPSAALSSAREMEKYYTDYHLPRVNKIVSDINELFIIDTAMTLRIAQALWFFRYRLVHDSTSIAAIISTTARVHKLLPAVVSEHIAGLYDLEATGYNAPPSAIARFSDIVRFEVTNILTKSGD